MAKTEKRSFRYEKRSREDVRERANMRGGNFDGIWKSNYKVWTPRDGKNLIRILPPTWDGAKHYGYDLFINYGIGVDNQSYLSRFKMLDDNEDPLMLARKEAEKDGDKEVVKALQPRQRIAYWIIDRNAEDEGPQIWAAPFTFDKDLANLCYDEDTKDIILLDDPEEGRDLRFYKEGKGLNTSYEASKMKIFDASPVHEDENLQKEWLDYIADNPLPDCCHFYDAEHIASVFDGHVRTAEKKDKDDDGDKRSSGSGRDRGRADRDNDGDRRPSRSRRDEDDTDADDRGSRNRRDNRDSDDVGKADDRKPASRRAAIDDDEDEKPRGRSARDEDDEKPRSRREKIDDDYDKEQDEEKGERDDRPPGNNRGSRRAAADDVEDDDGKERDRGASLRDRLNRRRENADEERPSRRTSR